MLIYFVNWTQAESIESTDSHDTKVYVKRRGTDCKNRHIFLNFNGIFDFSSGFVYGH